MSIPRYRALLEHSYDITIKDCTCPPITRLDYLGEYIFNFITYDSDVSILFSIKAVEVCKAITAGSTFDYISNADNYMWFLVMCNMPFFRDRLDWGSSIRGAWWDFQNKTIILRSTGLYENNVQLLEIKFNNKEWEEFITAITDFVATEVINYSHQGKVK